MIRSFQSKALRSLWLKDQAVAIKPEWLKRVRLILSTMDQASLPTELKLPGLGFHALSGDLRGRFAVTVGGNWRITFTWEGNDATDVDLEDCHGR